MSQKRSRNDHKSDNLESSQVVFVSGLKKDVTEADFHDSLAQYGSISYVLCLGDKALVEFETIRSAKECVMDSKVGTVEVAGYKVNIQFSKSEYIRRSGLESQYANNVLIVSVYNVLYPVTVDVIYQISSIHGFVMRIALLRGKDQTIQALVEFDSVASAKNAKQAMNGADIYSGCCTLKVEFSKVEKVTVKSNTHDQWDYTVNSPTLPSLSNFCQSNSTPPYLSDSFVNNHLSHENKNKLNRSYFPNAPSNPNYSSKPTYFKGFEFSTSSPMGFNENIINLRKRKMRDNNIPPSKRLACSSVLMIYGISQEHFNCDKIFNLLCPYGDCIKVKFLHSQKDCCMVEMKNEEDAYKIIKYLQAIRVYDRVIEVTFSHQESIKFPPNNNYVLPDGTPYFKSFEGNRNLRFNDSDAVLKNRFSYPNRKIHFFNSPPTFTEYGISEIFENHGVKPDKVLMMKKTERSSSGFAQFSTTSKAIEAVITCNHIPINSDCSKNPYIFKLAFAIDREE